MTQDNLWLNLSREWKETEDLDFLCAHIESVWVTMPMCGVQWVLSVWGKSLLGEESCCPTPTHHTTVWLTKTQTVAWARWSPHIFASCVFFQTISHCSSQTWALAVPCIPEWWTPSPEKGSKGSTDQKKSGNAHKEWEKTRAEWKSWPLILWLVALANPKPTRNEIGGKREEGIERKG